MKKTSLVIFSLSLLFLAGCKKGLFIENSLITTQNMPTLARNLGDTIETIVIDDSQIYEVSSRQVFLKEDNSYSLFLNCVGSATGTKYFDVYLSTEEERNWRKIVTELPVGAGDVDHFEEKEGKIICYFSVGTGGQPSTLISSDGGFTWEQYQ